MSENEIPEGLLDAQITVLDFYAEWCGPCRSLIPIIDELTEEYANDNSIKIIKVNVDVQPAIATKFGVRSIPNVVFVKNGEVVNKFTGVKAKSDIKNIIEEVRSSNN
jgi:thioredoxin 1